MAQENMASNLAELMIGECGIRFLTVNGFFVKGSDYDRFRRLCICVERDPTHPFSRHLQRVLQETFSISIPLCEENCNEIWSKTAFSFLSETLDFSADKWRSKFEILPPQCAVSSSKMYLDIHALQIEATDWQTWKAKAEKQLERCLEDDMDFFVPFSSDFQFEKPNLYRVELYLKGIEPNDRIWSAQLLYFVCDFCHRHRIRCRIDWSGDCNKLTDILQYVSKLTPIPDLLLRCETPAADPLLAICELVMEGRMGREDKVGVPPVLLDEK